MSSAVLGSAAAALECGSAAQVNARESRAAAAASVRLNGPAAEAAEAAGRFEQPVVAQDPQRNLSPNH